MNKSLRLLSWNVHISDFAKDSSYVVTELEKQSSPDIVCLQEYVQGSDATALNWLNNNDYDLEYLPFANYPTDDSISQGVLTATKKALKAKSEAVVLRKDEPRRFRNFPNIRGMIDTAIEMDGQVLSVLNFHATLPRPYTRDMRSREFSSLVGYLDGFPPEQALLLCGDFNFLAYDRRKNHLKQRFARFSGGVLSKTWRHRLAFSPLIANLDYLFWDDSSNVVDVDAKLGDFNVSDHRPIIADIEIQVVD